MAGGCFWQVLCYFVLLSWGVTLAVRPPKAVAQRDVELMRQGKVTSKTRERRAVLVSEFETWLSNRLPDVSLESMARYHPVILNEWLEAYILAVYAQGKTLQSASETVNGLCQKFKWLKGQMGLAWSVIGSWEMTAPPEHHPPIPVKLLKGMVSTALAWGWPKIAGLLLLGFFALLRPCEYIFLLRRLLLLPSDHTQGDFCFVRVLSPKTRYRGARHQYVRIDEPGIASFLDKTFGSLQKSDRLWLGSASTFRARFNLLQKTCVGTIALVLPSSLRTGGATFLFEKWNEDLMRLKWRGRWRSDKMLEIYIQELGALAVTLQIPVYYVSLLDQLNDLFPQLLK